MVNTDLMSIIFFMLSLSGLFKIRHDWLYYLFQVCMDLANCVPAPYDKCFITWTPMWHFVWICM